MKISFFLICGEAHLYSICVPFHINKNEIYIRVTPSFILQDPFCSPGYGVANVLQCDVGVAVWNVNIQNHVNLVKMYKIDYGDNIIVQRVNITQTSNQQQTQKHTYTHTDPFTMQNPE